MVMNRFGSKLRYTGMRTLGPLGLVFLLATSGCQQLQLDQRAPQGFNLSGTWHLLPALSDAPPNERRPGRRRPAGRAGPVDGFAFITHDFPVLAARRMRIEQNLDSMGVRYDKGGYRDISWGKRERGMWDVQAGWKDGALLVVSRSKGQNVTETMSLEDGGRTLVVDVQASGGERNLTLKRVFKR